MTLAGLGTVAGAVYKPELEIVPKVAFPPATPFTLQLAAVFDEPITVAVNFLVVEMGTAALAGAMLIVTGGAAVTLKFTGELVVPPRPLLVTVIGTFMPI